MGGDGSDELLAADDLDRFAMDLYFEVFQALVTLINRQVGETVRILGQQP